MAEKSPLEDILGAAAWRDWHDEHLESALAVIFARDREGELRPLGSGFMSTLGGREEGLIFSAGHVIETIAQFRESTRRSHPTALPEFQPAPPPVSLEYRDVVLLLGGKSNVMPMRPLGLMAYSDRDFGIIYAKPGHLDLSIEFGLDITSRIPAISDPIAILSNVKLEGDETPLGQSGDFEFTMSRRGSMRIGRVSAHHLSGYMLSKGPCVEVTIPAMGGMSGGAALAVNADGSTQAFGVVCCGPDDAHPSHSDQEIAGSTIVALIPEFEVTRIGDRTTIRFTNRPSRIAGNFLEATRKTRIP